ncbi:hypothetical protein Tco_0861003 [Tanacetum coccineum]|uniref:Uncharacterized protein n=1 Tax=Tanacetum coccineum TaxID=301880 RepID=A0ABQ5BH13_9ASTR
MTWVQDKASDDNELVLQEGEPTELVEDQGSGEKGEKEVTTPINYQTYIRRRRVVSTARRQVSTASEIEQAKKILEEEQAKAMTEQERERINLEAALELQRQLDKREEVQAEATQAPVIDWNDPSNQGGYNMNDFKGMSYDDISPIFEKQEEEERNHLLEKEEKESPSEESAKKQKLDDDAKKEELQGYLTITLENEGLNVESLLTRQDVLELYRLVKEGFQTTRPEAKELSRLGLIVLPVESSSTNTPLEQDASNVTPDSSNICNNDNQVDQHAAQCADKRAALANLITNLTIDTEENKKILKKLKIVV